MSKVFLPPAEKYGEKRRQHNQAAYPFLCSFIKFPYQASQVNSGTGIYSVTSANAIGPDGLTIAAGPGSVLDIPIVMDRDTNYHLLHIKYGAFNPAPVPSEGGFGYLVGSREVLLFPQSSLVTGEVNSLLTAQANQRIPYWTFLDVSAYMVSSGARDLYGGFARGPLDGSQQEHPIPILSLQGSKDGMGMVRTAFQLPKNASVRLRIVNRYTSALRVTGMLHGYKITI